MVTALLVVALASTAAVSIATHQAWDIRRTANLLDGDQTWLYAKAAETWAKVILQRDLKESERDGLDELWASHQPNIELGGGGTLSGKIEDMQGRFNINNLIDQEGKVDPIAAARFQRLLRNLDLDPELTQAVTDWIDEDGAALPPSGAEDEHYQSADKPYRTANRPMVDISELRLVRGFDQKTYDKVEPFVTALPTATPLNLNTAPAEVLAAISEKLDRATLESIVSEREKEPFEKPEDFTGDQRIKQAEVPEEDLQNLSVASNYFRVHSEAAIGMGRVTVETLMHRDEKGGLQVITRSLAP